MKTSEPEPSFAKYGWVAGIVAFAIIMCFGICYLAFKMYTWFKKPQQGFQMVDAELALEPLVADDHPNPPANHEVDGAVAVEAEAVSNEPPVPEFPEENVFNVCLDSQVMVSRGRYGSVWRARREVDGKLTYVAVKKHTENAFASYNAEKKIFDTLSEIPWYRSIVGYVGSHQMGQEYWIITEFQERLSLLSLIQNHVISLQAALRIILSMLDGLQFLHDERPFYYGDQKQAIIHRDIKSQNILIRSDMTACICDFGLAILVDEAVMRKRIEMLGQVGTRRYMAPEVLEGATEFTPAAFKQMDVYSMALVIWETLGRTKATEEDVVPEYMLPYEDHVGARPTLGEMREVACTKKLRPEFRPALFDNVKTEILVSTVRDMWDSLSDARLTAGCAFRRILKIAIEPLDISEGYYSEGRCEEDIMMDYHRLFTKHPTADPFLFEPKPPPVPLLGDDEPPEEPQVEEEPPRGNVVYDLDRQMLVHPDELVLRPRRSVDSTPTPTEMSSDDEFD